MAKLSTTNIYGNLTVDGEIINDSLDFDRIPYGSASGNVNVYTVTVNNFSLKDGKGISVKIPVNSTGACTLNVNGLGAKAIKKANGTDANNLKAGSIYTLRYNGTNFILQGESESGVANSAAKLTTARKINGVAFDGTRDITVYDSTKVLTSNNSSTTIHADADASSTTEFMSLKAGGNELKITSSGGGSNPAKNVNNLTYNGNVVYHAGRKPSPAEIGASTSSHTHDDRYYTETEINNKLSDINTSLNAKADRQNARFIGRMTLNNINVVTEVTNFQYKYVIIDPNGNDYVKIQVIPKLRIPIVFAINGDVYLARDIYVLGTYYHDTTSEVEVRLNKKHTGVIRLYLLYL